MNCIRKIWLSRQDCFWRTIRRRGVQILKEDGDLTAEEVQDVLGDYGYEHVRDSLEGRRFLRTADGQPAALWFFILIWGSCFLRKTQAQEGD